MRPVVSLLSALAFSALALAQTPPAAPKKIPAPGITLTDAERRELTAGAAALRRDLEALARDFAGAGTGAAEARFAALLPDAEIFAKAVEWTLRDDTFYTPKEIAYARTLLARGSERVAQLRAKQAPWLDATGTILRAHRSKLDGSVQPYALHVPANLDRTKPTPVLVWLLGRGEKRTELAFLAEREAAPPQIVPKDTIVAVPYGRFCNATKFAGEVDVFEALAAVRTQYRVDENRIAVGGFSMGGGSAWHLATHFPGLWCAATPGAGFAETPIFTKSHAPGREPRPAWEQLLWRHYEATGISGNLFNLPTLAYTGELDGQKEASDLMEAAMAKEGLKLERFIGPKTGHSYHAETKAELTQRFEALIAKGRDPVPREVRFSTYTLRYPEAAWARIQGLEKHWERADVIAKFTDETFSGVVATTKNVSALALGFVELLKLPSAARKQNEQAPLPLKLTIDGQEIKITGYDHPSLQLEKIRGQWHRNSTSLIGRKRPGLTGPVNDAFMEPFLFVRPSGKPLNPEVGAWVESELTAARALWRDVFRGEARVKADNTVTDADIANHNLILWGDPSSNAVLAKILAQLPVKWDAKELVFRGQTYDAKNHAPILILPNPLNPARYIVLNSGIDFRTEGYGNNAHQTPKLPDWAIVDLRTPPGPRWPGKIVEAGFFDESWK